MKVVSKPNYFYGFIIKKMGIHAHPNKIVAVIDSPLLTTISEIRSFLNAAGYLQYFVAGYAVTATPLYSSIGLNKNGIVNLDAEQFARWKTIKSTITSLPVLKPLSLDICAIIDCDASNLVLVGVLLQPHKYQGEL